MKTRDHTSRRYFLLQTIQWVVLAVLMLACYVFEVSGSMHKPLLLIPLALCISARTGEIQATAVGTACGLLLDVACGKLLGYNAFWLVICCVAVSLLHSYLLREKLLNLLMLTAVCALVQGYLDFLFYYGIWGHADVMLIYFHDILPCGLMTIVSTIPLYYLVRFLFRHCGSRRSYELEKTIVSDL